MNDRFLSHITGKFIEGETNEVVFDGGEDDVPRLQWSIDDQILHDVVSIKALAERDHHFINLLKSLFEEGAAISSLNVFLQHSTTIYMESICLNLNYH